jgi:Dolichyl-phosphate-mannose-protein mannosyltransferase
MTVAQKHLWILVAIFALGALLRLALLDRSGLWADEIFSLALATGHSLEHPAAPARPELGDFVEPVQAVPAEELRRYMEHESPPVSPSRVIRAVLLSDTSPPLYYLLLYAWTLICGTADIALRLFSTVCSLACLPLMASVARRIGGKDAVVPACLLFALSPLSIYYATEGRMYSLLLLCVLAMLWATLVLQERGDGAGIYVVWIGASAAGFLTHYFFIFPFLALVGYLFLQPGKLTRMRVIGCVLVVGALILPWYIRLSTSLGNWRVTQGWLKLRPGHFNRAIASIDVITQFFSARAHELWLSHLSWHVVALLLFLPVAAAGLWRLGRQAFTGKKLLLWLLFVAGCAGPFASDLVQHTYMVAKPRYAIAALPAAYLLAAIGFAYLSVRVRAIILTLIALAWAPNVWSIHRKGAPWEPMREIAEAASANTQPSDLILVHSIPSGVLAMARYTKGNAPLTSWVQQLGNRRVPESVEAVIAGRRRIVFVKVHAVEPNAPEEAWLRAHAVPSSGKHLGLGLIVDFHPRDREIF